MGDDQGERVQMQCILEKFGGERERQEGFQEEEIGKQE